MAETANHLAFKHKILCNLAPMPRRKKDTQPNEMSCEGVRLDKWLWAARFFKTRQLAVKAIKSGRVEVNGVPAKSAHALSVEDTICFTKDKLKYEIVVKAMATRRQPAKLAADLYRETSASIAAREEQIARIRLQSMQVRFDQKKPDRRRRQESRLVKRRVSQGTSD